MTNLIRLTAEERDNLTAYLDGELDEAAARAIESKLSISQVVRHDVELMANTYELLDLLPRAKVSSGFTEKTLQLAVLRETPVAGEAIRRALAKVSRAGILLIWLAVVAALGFVGFQATHAWIPNDAATLLTHLPLIQNLDLYAEVGSLEFLEELRRHDTFAEADAPPREPRPGEPPPPAPHGSPGGSAAERLGASSMLESKPEVAARQERIARMTETERLRLKRNFDLYASLGEEERSRYAALHAALMADAGGRSLRETMERYCSWVKTLDVDDREKLRQESHAVRRRELVDRLRERQLIGRMFVQRPSGFGPPPLEADDLQRVFNLVERKLRESGAITAEISTELARRTGYRRYRLLIETWLTRTERGRQVNEATVKELAEAIADPQMQQAILRGSALEEKRGQLMARVIGGLFSQMQRELVKVKPGDEAFKLLISDLPESDQKEIEAQPTERQRSIAAYKLSWSLFRSMDQLGWGNPGTRFSRPFRSDGNRPPRGPVRGGPGGGGPGGGGPGDPAAPGGGRSAPQS